MAKVSIPTKIDIPDKIEIRLVREDHIETSGTYRIIFEVFLALTTALIGAYLTINNLEFIHYLLLFIAFASCITFFLLMVRYNRKSRDIKTDSNLDTFPFKTSDLAVNIKLQDKENVSDILKNMGLSIDSIHWHTNRIKTDYTTLRINKIESNRLGEFLEKLKEKSIDYKDEKLIL
jgi:Ca2+/Na+ antiporter